MRVPPITDLPHLVGFSLVEFLYVWQEVLQETYGFEDLLVVRDLLSSDYVLGEGELMLEGVLVGGFDCEVFVECAGKHKFGGSVLFVESVDRVIGYLQFMVVSGRVQGTARTSMTNLMRSCLVAGIQRSSERVWLILRLLSWSMTMEDSLKCCSGVMKQVMVYCCQSSRWLMNPISSSLFLNSSSLFLICTFFYLSLFSFSNILAYILVLMSCPVVTIFDFLAVYASLLWCSEFWLARVSFLMTRFWSSMTVGGREGVGSSSEYCLIDLIQSYLDLSYFVMPSFQRQRVLRRVQSSLILVSLVCSSSLSSISCFLLRYSSSQGTLIAVSVLRLWWATGLRSGSVSISNQQRFYLVLVLMSMSLQKMAYLKVFLLWEAVCMSSLKSWQELLRGWREGPSMNSSLGMYPLQLISLMGSWFLMGEESCYWDCGGCFLEQVTGRSSILDCPSGNGRLGLNLRWSCLWVFSGESVINYLGSTTEALDGRQWWLVAGFGSCSRRVWQLLSLGFLSYDC